jgi:hypothetical protein
LVLVGLGFGGCQGALVFVERGRPLEAGKSQIPFIPVLQSYCPYIIEIIRLYFYATSYTAPIFLHIFFLLRQKP